MGTKLNPSKYDCYANAEPDEPMFVLLGRDPQAPTLVWLWSVLRELHDEDPAKVQEARAIVVEMINFASKKGKKVPGLGEAALASVLELIRGANYGVTTKLAKNEPISSEDFRVFLLKTAFEQPDPVATTIIVNGKECPAVKGKVDYEWIVKLAEYTWPNSPSMTWCRGKGNRQEGGILHPGMSVMIEGGEIFSVHDTGNA
jgi:hypothetical protein